ncbi:MAG: hypothetical protein ACNS64_01855 [Candidatus Halalkalibacterium sp. M3_1C_030]
MEDSIEVKEKYSNNWKPTLYSSLLIAIITFLLYLNLDDVLWGGVIRLIAFMSFSLSIFCMLKVMEGAKTFRLSVSDELLSVAYLKNDEILQTEEHRKEEIQSIYKLPYQLKIPFTEYRFKLPGNRHFKVKFDNEEERDMSLFKFGGRVLTVDNESGQNLEQFFKKHKLYSEP